MKAKDFVNFVVVGSRYQVQNEKGEAVNEFGVGRFRSGILLELAMDIYARLVTRSAEVPLGAKKNAASLAANAFSLSEVFLDEMDKHFRTPPPPENNNNSGRK